MEHRDLLADIVVADVPTHVRATMSEDQLQGVRSAAKRRHAVDVRFTVPLFFTRLYFVLLVGRDARTQTQSVEHERRAVAGIHLSSFAIGAISAALLAAAFVCLYVIKSRAGINVFPGHLKDYLPFLK